MTDGEKQIHALVDQFVEGWNKADGPLCARPFAADADFIAVTGLHAKGRELIAQGHSEILATVFRGSRMTSTVNTVRFLRPDVAVADVTLRLTFRQPPAWQPDYTSAGLVATRENGAWSIAVFRNLAPLVRPMDGAVEQKILREQVDPELTAMAR